MASIERETLWWVTLGAKHVDLPAIDQFTVIQVSAGLEYPRHAFDHARRYQRWRRLGFLGPMRVLHWVIGAEVPCNIVFDDLECTSTKQHGVNH